MQRDYTERPSIETKYREGSPETTWRKSMAAIPAAQFSPAFQCDQPRHQTRELTILDVPAQMNPQMTTAPSQHPVVWKNYLAGCSQPTEL